MTALPLIKKCPKCGHVRQPHEITSPEQCPSCGVYFEKWANRDKFVSSRERRLQEQILRKTPWQTLLLDALPTTKMDAVQRYSYTALLCLLFIWSIRLVTLDYATGEINSSFMHTILLPIHEAGHIFFIPLGHFFTILGGSLFQLLLPLISAGTLLWQNRDAFGAALGLWWCGTSLLDLAPYIYDAQHPQLTLLGGHTGEDGPHDWIYLLGVFNKIDHAPFYGALTHTLGILIMITGLSLAATLLWMNVKAESSAEL